MGQGLPIIGKLLGHSQSQTTARYAHLAATPAIEVADKISASWAGCLNSIIYTQKEVKAALIGPDISNGICTSCVE